MYQLSEGAIDKIMHGIKVCNPIFQILGYKRIDSSPIERYRLLISDGKKSNSFTVLSTKLNHFITEKLITEYAIFEFVNYSLSLFKNSGNPRHIMIILDIKMLASGNEIGSKMGNPIGSSGSPKVKCITTSAESVTDFNRNADSSTSDILNQPTSSRAQIDNLIVTIPIAQLNPYQNRWIIKARVTNKSDIRHWRNLNGEGKLFVIDLIDKSGEIRCTAFREQCDKFYNIIEVGKVYFIRRGVLKVAMKQYSTLKNDYEITLTKDSEILCCDDETDEIPTIQFKFIPIGEISLRKGNEALDVIGIIKSVGDVQTFTARTTGKELKKREIQIVDKSKFMVTLTLWETQAEDFKADNNSVLVLKGARVSEFSGKKSLSLVIASVMQINPNIPEAHRLREWYNTVGRYEIATSISMFSSSLTEIDTQLFTIKELRNFKSGYLEMSNVCTVKATISSIKVNNALYKSCPVIGCYKKVVDQSNGMYKCEKCKKEYPNFKYRLLGQINISDWSGNIWITVFNEDVEKLLGSTARKMGELFETDKGVFEDKFTVATLKTYIFKLKVKTQIYNDEERLNITVTSITPVSYSITNSILLKSINNLLEIKKF